MNEAAPLTPTAPGTFVGGGRTLVVADSPPGVRPGLLTVDAEADTLRFEPVDPFDPTPVQLERYVGTWHSPEAEVTYTTEVGDGRLLLVDRYGERRPITPVYPDTFEGGPNVFRFLRDAEGEITEMRWGQSRVWSLRFERIR